MSGNYLAQFANDIKQYKDRVERIRILGTKLRDALLSGSQYAFAIGRELYEQKLELAHGDSISEWLIQNELMAPATARNYLRLYEFFAERQNELASLTIMEAYCMAGIRAQKALPEKTEEDEKTYGGDREEDWDETALKKAFRKKPLSNADLKDYRVEIYDNELWGFRRGFGRFPALDIRLTQPAGMPDIDWNEMRANLQIALESYYAKVERYEHDGIVQAPRDSRYKTLAAQKK